MPRAVISERASGLRGTCRAPGDKSISHRALMIGALAVGPTEVDGLLESEDVLRTAAALEALGVPVAREAEGRWRVDGAGVGGLAEPGDVLDMGNSGTAVRLLMGVLAAHPFTTFFTGDASLRARPMERVAEPLRQMGARVVARQGGRLPLALIGTADPMPITYRLPVPSAQVKSAILLAGLGAPGETRVIEPQPSRDHTERMLRRLGAQLDVTDEEEGRAVRLRGQVELSGRPLSVPADPSAAAFPLVAALVAPDSEVRLPGVGVNPLRSGLLRTLVEMGAEVELGAEREVSGEPVADIVARSSRLRGIEVPAERAPSMIDEYPVLAVAAACAEGETLLAGLGELRVKESDRLAAVAEGLSACGVEVRLGPDWLAIRGCGGAPPGGGTIAARLDHRIAMSFLVLGMASRRPVTIDDVSTIGTSFPAFVDTMNALGARLREIGEG